jgi:hypothetical protein
MRFGVVVALLVVTFAVCFSSVASEQNNLRRLKSSDLKPYSDAATEEERDTSSLVRKFATNLKKSTAANKAAGRVAGVAAKNTAFKQKEVQKMGKAVADVAVKDPKKWSTLKKILVSTLGVSAATAVIVVAYNAFKANSAATAATSSTTTTTAGSL